MSTFADELNDRIENKTPALVYKAIEPSFTWETVAGYLQHCADNEVGQPVGILNYKLPVADQIDSIRPVREYLSEHIKEEITGADLYVTFTTKCDSKYTNKNDILLWNVLGYSQLDIEGEERVVEPGDLIYVPSGIEYTYKPSTARASVVFGVSRRS